MFNGKIYKHGEKVSTTFGPPQPTTQKHHHQAATATRKQQQRQSERRKLTYLGHTTKFIGGIGPIQNDFLILITQFDIRFIQGWRRHVVIDCEGNDEWHWYGLLASHYTIRKEDQRICNLYVSIYRLISMVCVVHPSTQSPRSIDVLLTFCHDVRGLSKRYLFSLELNERYRYRWDTMDDKRQAIAQTYINRTTTLSVVME